MGLGFGSKGAGGFKKADGTQADALAPWWPGHAGHSAAAEGAPPPLLPNRAGEEAGKEGEGEDDRWARVSVINGRSLKIETKVFPGSKIYGKISDGR
jgi:hypothetical protein